jgi:hypothetical protein
MTKNYEYSENLAFTDSDAHSAIVSHFNKIAEIAENKRFEWEDEKIPEENFGITYDLDEWLHVNMDFLAVYHYPNDLPENLKEYTISYVDQLKEYIDGFMLLPCVMFNGRGVEGKSCKTSEDNFDEVVKFMRDLKENNKMVFLYQISRNYMRNVETKIGNVTYFPTKGFYTLRYAVIEND